MAAVAMAVLAAIGFAGTALVAARSGVPPGVRGYATAVGGALLLGVAFGDLFPEALEMAGDAAIAGFVGGFAALLLVETFSHAHTHHAPGEAQPLHTHRLGPFVIGLAFHNAADGFALGVGAEHSAGAVGLLALGVVLHQFPVGLSLAAVLAAEGVPRPRIVRTAAVLALLIPLAAAPTAAIQVEGERGVGLLTGIAGGMLTYVAAAHLLPQAQAETDRRSVALAFAATLGIVTAALLMVVEG